MVILFRSKKVIFPLSMTLGLVGLVMISLSFVFSSYFQPLGENWQHLRAYVLTQVMLDTIILLILNMLGCLFIGVGLAWCVCRYEFYGRWWLQWLLLFPLSMPPYVSAFILFDVFDPSGYLNNQLGQIFGVAWGLDLQHLGYTSFAMVMVFYPYVYWLVRSALLSMRGNLIDSAASLGLGELGLFWRVVMPMIRPAIIAGLSLVLLETLADFGAVSIFNVDTLSTLIYKMWFSFFDLRTALQVSALLLLVVGLFYLLRQLIKPKGEKHNLCHSKGVPRLPLSGIKKCLVSIGCWLMIVVFFFLPIIALFCMMMTSSQNVSWTDYAFLFQNTLLIGAWVSALLVGLSIILVVTLHQLQHDVSCRSHHQMSQLMQRLCALLRLGYALPGSVVAMSLIGVAIYVDEVSVYLGWGSILVGGSLWVLIWAYMIRFFAVAINTLSGSINQISGNLQAVAISLGLSNWQIRNKVYLPNLKIPMLSALVLVFMEVIKEMPATLMLHPAQWETFAVRIYSYTSEGEWANAALPAFSMVMLCVLFIVLSLWHKED